MFPSLHRHDGFSTVGRGNDGAGHPLDAAKHAKEMGATSLGITNHGVLFGLIEFYKACKEVGIHPVLGIETYYQPVYTKPPDKDEKKSLLQAELELADYEAEQYHLTLWIKNSIGYRNLMKMLTIASKENYYYHPVITDELLEQYHEGLILATGCLGSYTSQHIIHGRSAEAHIKADFFKSLFGDDFYLEVMPNQSEDQAVVNRTLELWYDLEQWPIVMTEDAHYTRKEDYESYQILRTIRKNPDDKSVVDYSTLYMHTEEEILSLWETLMGSVGYAQKYIDEAQRIAVKCQVEFDSTVHLPKLPGIEDQQTALIAMASKGAIEKGKYYVNGGGKKRLLPAYKERLDYEVEIILDKGFEGYMLINADMAREAKERGIAIQGRGSVCGSLLAYFLGIHTVDSLRYNLPFERFCGPDRVGYPDIDSDVEDRRRDEIIAYVCERYGGNASPICTFGRLKALSLYNHLTKILAIENGDAERFKNVVRDYIAGLDDPVLSKQDMLEIPDFLYLEQKYKLVTHFFWLWNQIVYVGTHAAGIALTVGDVTDKFAIVRVGSGKDISYVTCYDGGSIEEVGCLKLDILGLNTLSMLADAEKEAGLFYSPVTRDRGDEKQALYDEEDLESDVAMNIFRNRDTLGIFQSEKKTPQRMYLQIRPKSIADLAIVNACNRPEPMHEGTFDKVLASRKNNGNGGVEVPAVFQEDIMERCLKAGLSWEQIAKVLKSLKKYTINDPETEAIFVTGLVVKGFDEDVARAQWHAMRHYLFNKGHATAYSHLAARQAYLKGMCPYAFSLGILMNERDKDKRRLYEIDAVRHGTLILLPHVNGSANYSKVEDKFRKYIQQGLIVLEGIGEAVANQIVEARGDVPYVSVKDYKNRCGLRVATLEKYGALDFDAKVPEKHFTRVRSFMKCSADFNAMLKGETQTSL